MKRILLFIDSVLFAVKPEIAIAGSLVDPTVYIILTKRQSYCGNIIFQDDRVIKFRTVALKPVKILKSNIRQIKIFRHAYLTAS